MIESERESAGRQPDGRFSVGNKISRGNTGNLRMKELRRALLECATPERVAAVEKTLYEAAVAGDVAAIRVWLEHMVGKPVQAVELSGPDGESFDLPTILGAILTALGDDQAARIRVAAAFRAMGGGSDAAGTGPGS